MGYCITCQLCPDWWQLLLHVTFYLLWFHFITTTTSFICSTVEDRGIRTTMFMFDSSCPLFTCIHCIILITLVYNTFRSVLFICKYENDGVPHLPIIDDPVQLLARLVYPVPVCTVHHKYQALGPCVIVSPQRSDFILPTYILK